MFDTHCRFCSHEHLFVPYTPLITNPKTNRLEAAIGKTMIKKEPVGIYCNNSSSWVSDLKFCPARWALHRKHYGDGRVADGTGTYTEPVVAPSILFRVD
jgi:hypothetical protein